MGDKNETPETDPGSPNARGREAAPNRGCEAPATPKDADPPTPGIRRANDLPVPAKPKGGALYLVAEFWDFLKVRKKWWLIPIILMLLLTGTLIALGQTAVAPFIYTLF